MIALHDMPKGMVYDENTNNNDSKKLYESNSNTNTNNQSTTTNQLASASGYYDIKHNDFDQNYYYPTNQTRTSSYSDSSNHELDYNNNNNHNNHNNHNNNNNNKRPSYSNQLPPPHSMTGYRPILPDEHSPISAIPIRICRYRITQL